MQSKLELSATIRKAMKRKNLSSEELSKTLGISSVMTEKLLCGEVVPSRHLEKQMTEILGIASSTVTRVSARRERQSKNKINERSAGRKAA